MNVLKNMEAIFLVAAVLAGVATYASAAPAGDSPAAPARRQGQAVVEAQQAAPMAVVHVRAKRLSAAEKAAL